MQTTGHVHTTAATSITPQFELQILEYLEYFQPDIGPANLYLYAELRRVVEWEYLFDIFANFSELFSSSFFFFKPTQKPRYNHELTPSHTIVTAVCSFLRL